MPFAVVLGTPVDEPPKDLYIPPDALEVFLEAFEGPLDLLIYLIKKQNLDILDIPIARITEQYTRYIDMMQALKIDLAAEYLVMAAMLAEIKSRMLLPRPTKDDEEEKDPRAELILRLQEYEQFRKAALELDKMPRIGRDWFEVQVSFEKEKSERSFPDVKLEAVLESFRDVLKRAEMFADHQVFREPLSVRERMTSILQKASSSKFKEFQKFFDSSEGRSGVVVTMVAILELLKESLLEIVQNGERDPVYIRLAKSSEERVS